jgi:L-asparaginase
MESRPCVALLALGGTIAMAADASGVSPGLSAADLMRAVPALDSIAEIEVHSLRCTASPNLGVAEIHDLARWCERCISAGAAGIVITQGTDTLEENAFLLDLLVQARVPIVMTGALRNPTLLSSDGAANLRDAMLVATHARAGATGVLVVMNGQIHAARYVHKAHTYALHAFVSDPCGPVGWLSEGRVRIVMQPVVQRPRIPGPIDVAVPFVGLYATFGGDDGRALSAFDHPQVAGVVVQTLGTGHVCAELTSALARLAASRPVVYASRIPAGEMFSRTYAYPGAEIDLLAKGLVCAGDLSAQKARMLLASLLAAGEDRAAISRAFAACAS